MKKDRIYSVLCLFIILLIFTACGAVSRADADRNSNADVIETTQELISQMESEPVETEGETITFADQDLSFSVEYFQPGVKEDKVLVVRDTGELERCLKIIEKGVPDSLINKYDEEWFKSHILIFVGEVLSSGSETIEIERVRIEDNQLWLDVFIKSLRWDSLPEERKEAIRAGKEEYTYSRQLNMSSTGGFVEIDREYSEMIETMTQGKITYIKVLGKVTYSDMSVEIKQGEEIK